MGLTVDGNHPEVELYNSIYSNGLKTVRKIIDGLEKLNIYDHIGQNTDIKQLCVL